VSASAMTRTTDLAEVARHPSSRRATTGQLARTGKRWVFLAVLLAVTCTVGGVFVGSQVPVRYTSEVRLSVGQSSLKTLSVPGYVQATEQLAGTYARYVNTGTEGLDDVGARLGLSPGSLVAATASPIAESNILRIQVEGTSGGAASLAATAIADSLVQQVNAPPDDRSAQKQALLRATRKSAEAQQAVTDAETALAAALEIYRRAHPSLRDELQPPTSPEIEEAKGALSDARSTYALQQLAAQEATDAYQNAAPEDLENVGLTVVRAAGVVDDTRSRYLQWGGLAGLALGVVLGFSLLSLVSRRSRPHG